jgi:GH15 family glucan-1,4-alpha-glucosidase
MDGPSVFAALLDRGAGWFRLGPADLMVPSGRRYLPGTMVLETTWGTPTGWAVVRDVLLVGPWRHDSARSGTHRRAPADHSAERVLLRTVRCLQGSMDFVLECEPAFDYGRQRGTWRHIGSGYGQAEVSAGEQGPLLRLTTDLNVGLEGPQAFSHLALINAVIHLIREDERHSAAAVPRSGLDPAPGAAPAVPGEEPAAPSDTEE